MTCQPKVRTNSGTSNERGAGGAGRIKPFVYSRHRSTRMDESEIDAIGEQSEQRHEQHDREHGVVVAAVAEEADQ